MIREYKNSILFVEKCLYIHKYMFISYEIIIRERLHSSTRAI